MKKTEKKHSRAFLQFSFFCSKMQLHFCNIVTVIKLFNFNEFHTVIRIQPIQIFFLIATIRFISVHSRIIQRCEPRANLNISVIKFISNFV